MMINSHLKRQWFGKPTYKKDGWTSRVYTLHDLRFSSIGTWVWNDEMHLTKNPVEQSAPKSTPIHTASLQETKDSTDESEAKKKVETETWCCFKTMSRCTHLPEINVFVFTFTHILLHCMWRKWWHWRWWFVWWVLLLADLVEFWPDWPGTYKSNTGVLCHGRRLR